MKAQAFFSLWRWEQYLKLLYCLSDLIIVTSIVDKSDAEASTNIFKHTNSKLAIFVKSICGTTERALESKAIDKIKLSPHDHSSSGFSRLLDYEITIIEAEIFSVLMEKKWEYPLFKTICLLIRATIHESILLSRVTMIITIEENISAFKGFSHHHL